MQNVLQMVVNEAGHLLHAHETRFDSSNGFVTMVTLTFQHLTVNIRADPDNDTISINLGAPLISEDGVTASADASSPWIPAYGSQCVWAWTLTNQQGYSDGLRFEFISDAGKRVVEMIVAASQIQYYALETRG